MAFKPLEVIKAHPYMAGGAVFVIGLIIVLSMSGGRVASQPETVGYPTTDASTVAANSALAQTQLQAGVANQATAAQLSTNLAGIAANSQADQLNAQNQNLALNLQSSVALANIAAQKETQQMVSTLSASVQNAQTQAATAMNANNNATQTQIAGIAASTQSMIAGYTAMMQDSINKKDIAVNANNNATQLGLANTFANVNINQTNANRDMFNKQQDSANYLAGLNYQLQDNQSQRAYVIDSKQVDSADQKNQQDFALNKATMEQQAAYAHAQLFQRAYANQFSIIANNGPIPF